MSESSSESAWPLAVIPPENDPPLIVAGLLPNWLRPEQSH